MISGYERLSLCVIGLLLSGCAEPPQPPDAAQAPMEAPAAVGALPGGVLVTGAAISGANGIHFGPDGLLYVASVLGSELVLLDRLKALVRAGAPDATPLREAPGFKLAYVVDAAFHDDNRRRIVALARGAGVKRVEPFHFSPRHAGEDERIRAEVLAAFAGC